MSSVDRSAISRRKARRLRRRLWTTVSCSPATTCALVTTSSDVAAQPEPSIAETARGAEHAHDARAPPTSRRARRRPPARRRHAGPGPEIAGSGSKARASALSSGARRRQRVVVARCRISERWMSTRSRWSPRASGASTVPRGSRRSRARRTAERPAPSSPSITPRPGSGSARDAGEGARPSAPDARIAPASSGAEQPEGRSVRRGRRPAGAAWVASRVPMNAPSGKAVNDSTPTMKPRRVPGQGQQRRERRR